MGIKKITVLEEKENSTIVMVYRSFFGFMKSLYYEYGCYVDFPIILERDKLTLSIFGEEKSLKKFIEYLNSIKFKYKILQVTEYHFEVSSILNHLTAKQKEYLVKAYDNGYYEIPRKVTSREIAKNLGISHQALIENLRKAEKKIMDYVIG